MERKEPISETYLMDCMDYMRQFPDKHFELAIVDPPYGIGEDGKKNHSRGKATKPTMYSDKSWDRSAPPAEYFAELIRVSKNVIIWGANHFIERIPNANSSSWVIWDKQNGDNDFADCEMAWTNHSTAVRKFTFRWAGMLQGDMKEKEIRIHPTQKPAALYKWLLHNYAKQGDKILDTHLGSQSSRIAAYGMGFDFYGTELDTDYFEQGNKRFEQYRSQLTLF
jgi:site-specific DNA-methyltransferase (adenine-specific)